MDNVFMADLEQIQMTTRTRLLQETDWIVFASKETGNLIHQDWIAYRQALRDITLHPKWPTVFPWPEKPSSNHFADDIHSVVVAATQKRLDDFARTRNYDGILSLCTYATSTNPTFAKEGQYGVNMRDATWAKLYEMLAEVEAGIRPVPTGYVDIEAELPVLGWPV